MQAAYNPGKMRHRVLVLKKTKTRSPSGAEIITWVPQGGYKRGFFRSITAIERGTEDQVNVLYTHKLDLWKSSTLTLDRDIHRIEHKGQVYSIFSVIEPEGVRGILHLQLQELEGVSYPP